MLVTDEQVRNHLRIEAGEDVSVYVGAAQESAQQFLNRRVYASAEDMASGVLAGTAGLDPMIANDAIRAAILLILGHLYANREEVVTGTIATELPMTSRRLLQPYRKGMGV